MVDVATFCGNCGRASAAGDRYCRGCGSARFDLPVGASENPIVSEESVRRSIEHQDRLDSRDRLSTNGFAIASMVLGILWIYWIGSILALVFGYIAKKQIRDSFDPEWSDGQKGRGIATAGIVLGWIGIAAFIAVMGIAIAIPQFLGARQRAQDGAVQSDLRNALTAEKTYYTDSQSYTNDTATLAAIEPSLPWNAVGGPQVSVGDVVTGDGNVVCLQETSNSGTTLSIADVAVGDWSGTYYNKGTCSTSVVTVATWTGW
jgi:type II secretory pathway pseudopilin PulG